MTVPIPVSSGRPGFDPQLTLFYDSRADNGLFGIGWNLYLPSIARRIDKGLPQYRDVEGSAEFILSGSEDLVPVLKGDGTRFADRATVAGFTMHRYRPHIEGLFARIERCDRRERTTRKGSIYLAVRSKSPPAKSRPSLTARPSPCAATRAYFTA